MSDNSTMGGTTDSIRDKDRAGVKTQIVGLDLGIGTGTEALMVPGQAAKAASIPVVLPSDMFGLEDLYVAPQASVKTSANLLGAGASIDCLGYKTLLMQVIMATGTVTAGQVQLQGSNDGVSWANMPMSNVANGTFPEMGGVNGNINLFSLFASPAIMFIAPVITRYVRLAISVTITGTTAGCSVAAVLKAGAPVNVGFQTVVLQAGTTINPAVTTTNNATYVSLASTNGALIIGASVSLFSLVASNSGAAAAFLKIYNKSGSPVVGTDVPSLTIPIPPGDVKAVDFGALGFKMSLGIAIAITNLFADSDTTAIAAAQVKLMIAYK